MAISHEGLRVPPERRRWSELLVPEMWASLAIAVIWLAVLFDAILGPDNVRAAAYFAAGAT
jgi:hypothetical protein